ncbi:MAG: hypothetical protein ACLSFT_03100 [Ruminococcus callidus]
MTVEPGFGGQSFLWDMVEKVKALRQYAQEHGLSYQIEVDGGINAETALVSLKPVPKFWSSAVTCSGRQIPRRR